MTKDFNKICKDEKTKLFQRLNEKAKESDLPLKVLEIGGGTGANFEFITEPINWTTIEPNEHCNVINVKNQKNWDSKFEFGGIIQGASFNWMEMKMILTKHSVICKIFMKLFQS